MTGSERDNLMGYLREIRREAAEATTTPEHGEARLCSLKVLDYAERAAAYVETRAKETGAV